jgi:hypothetical protein
LNSTSYWDGDRLARNGLQAQKPLQEAFFDPFSRFAFIAGETLAVPVAVALINRSSTFHQALYSFPQFYSGQLQCRPNLT